MSKEKPAREGVADAWDFWLNQHPVSVPEIVKEAIAEAFRRWLDDNEEKVLATIKQTKLE